MLHLDLFSGIGGFAYAADQVFGDVEHIFCDNDPFCRQVLKKHWPESEIYDDIRLITDTGRKHGSKRSAKGSHGQTTKWSETTEETQRLDCIDLLTGGFPCQPFSQAGLRRGTADDRFLWPEMLRVIRLIKPEWVIAENVRGLLTLEQGVVFEQVCTDLETSGYEVQPFIIPAVAVNTPHRRDRIWFVGHAKYDGLDGAKDRKGGYQRDDSNKERTNKLRQSERTDSIRKTPTNSQHTGLERRSHESTGYSGQLGGSGGSQRPDWNQDWFEVATEFCSVDDGLPVELDGFKLSKSQNRNAQLKAYGNAIVPEVAMNIMQAIKEAHPKHHPPHLYPQPLTN